MPLGDSITAYGDRYDRRTKLVDAGYRFDLVGSTSGCPLMEGAVHPWPPHAGQEPVTLVVAEAPGCDTDWCCLRAG